MRGGGGSGGLAVSSPLTRAPAPRMTRHARLRDTRPLTCAAWRTHTPPRAAEGGGGGEERWREAGADLRARGLAAWAWGQGGGASNLTWDQSRRAH